MTEVRAKNFQLPSKQDVFVLVVVTGGTIAMKRNDGREISFDRIVDETPVLNDPLYRKKLGASCTELGSVFVMPRLQETEGRVVYCLHKFETFKPSCDMNLDDHKKIATTIGDNYSHFSGFVVLHGTDTMAYTASYLSFMFENLGKSVVLTGAQIPIFETRNDAVDNLLGALIVAGTHNVPEVTIYFSNALHRGNRTRKVDAIGFAAFAAPNFEPLIRFGVDMKIKSELLLTNVTNELFSVNLEMDKCVGILRLYPGLTVDIAKAFLSPPMKGLVLCSYGTGHISSYLLKEIAEASKRGVLVLNCTQCDAGGIPSGEDKALLDAGVINGRDVTSEAGLAKLSYVLGKTGLLHEERRALLEQNLRGEITKAQSRLMCVSVSARG